MAKSKSTFFCQNCGVESAKWIGNCPSCNEWNTYVEELIEAKPKALPDWKSKENSNGITRTKISSPIPLAEIPLIKEHRLITGDNELNRALGGGIVPGSLVLIGGEPGIGKSTLMLQLALSLKNIKVLYISGEESEQQLKMRADRLLENLNGNTSYANADLAILTETSTQNIFKQIAEYQPSVVVVDSIQTLYSTHIESAPGSVSQIRECTAELLRFAKETSTPVFLVGHITKEGTIAGPKILEHMVDTVLQFEGDRHHTYRILRSIKNRFGSTSEMGIYEMGSGGLREVSNPSEILLSYREEPLSGIAVSAMIEGLRPILIESQALVSSAVYGTPQRSSTGFDLRRTHMLLAVLEKRCGFRIGVQDVFLNITGGIKVEDPALDMGVICSILSSHENMPISYKTCFAGEVGLSGEIRAVSRIEQRVAEAAKLGFEKIYISKYNKKGLDQSKYTIEIIGVSKVEELFELLFA